MNNTLREHTHKKADKILEFILLTSGASILSRGKKCFMGPTFLRGGVVPPNLGNAWI